MDNELLQQVKSFYDLEGQIKVLRKQEAELTERVEGAEAVLSTLSWELSDRENSIGAKLKKLLKKDDPELDALRDDVRQAEHQLSKVQNELAACKQELAAANSKKIRLPMLTTLRRRAQQDPETAKAFGKLELKCCVEQVNPLLDANRQALRELADFYREHKLEKPFPQTEFNRLFNGTIAAAEACMVYLTRIETVLEGLKCPHSFKPYYYHYKDFLWDAGNGPDIEDRAKTAMQQIKAEKDGLAVCHLFII